LVQIILAVAFSKSRKLEPKACSQMTTFAHNRLSRSANSTAATDLLLAVVRTNSSSKLPAMPPFMFVTHHELLSPVASPDRLQSASNGDPALPFSGGGLPSGGAACPTAAVLLR
jgi:hypothetical protein